MTINALIWEERAIGTLLVDPHTVDELEGLGPADISRRYLKLPFATAVGLAKRDTLTKQALIAAIQAAGDLSDVGNETLQGEAYIDYLISLGAPRSMPEFASQIRDASTNRRIIEVATLAIQKAERSENPATTIQWLAKEIGGLIRTHKDPRLVASLNADYTARALKIRSGEIQPFWSPPIQALEEKAGKVQDVDFVIVPGKPGTGKSSFLRYSGLQTARQGDTVLMVTLENSEDQVHSWALAALARIDHLKIIDPSQLSAEEFERVEEAKRTLETLPYHVVEMGVSSIDEVTAKIRKFCLQHPTSVVLVDGLYLIQNGDNLFEGISSSMQTMRSIAQDLHVPVVGTNQFRKDQKPARGETVERELGLDDMFFSGEKQATKVWKIKRRELSEGEKLLFPLNLVDGRVLKEPRSTVVSFQILKNSEGIGSGGTLDVAWHMPWGVYESLVPGWQTAGRAPADVSARTMYNEPVRAWKPALKPVKTEKPKPWSSIKRSG
ncbi:MAG: DnaB-like helicase C-terminal domain-containing protein [Chloroflexota bacterium]